MKELFDRIYEIINEIEWEVERNREIKLSKRDYKIILIVMQGYLELRKELLESKKKNEKYRKSQF